jgi:hypothetical protein
METEYKNLIWLASYPRSGNTLLRTILWNCFGFRSGTVYLNEFKGKERLAEYVGHIEPIVKGAIQFPQNNPPLVKTHACYRNDENPAIYVVRDGRAVSVSLSKFYSDLSFESIIEGRHMFGTWTAHLKSWKPWQRPDTLLLRYEDMVEDLPSTLDKISKFLNRDIIKDRIPDRNTIAEADGRIVRKKSDWRSEFPEEMMKRFLQINGAMLERMGYTS